MISNYYIIKTALIIFIKWQRAEFLKAALLDTPKFHMDNQVLMPPPSYTKPSLVVR
jgi:hypothetical protein